MKYLLMLSLLLAPLSLFAQQTIKGQIINHQTGLPVAKAFIGIKGSTTTVQADKQGLFTINAGLPAILMVYSPGYDTAKQAVDQPGTFQHISLKPAAHVLNEIDITATSGKDRSPLYQPAAISKLSSRELKRGDGLFLRDAINQNVPGVYMESRSVAGGQQINIRGYGNGHGFKGVTNNFDGQGLKVYYNGIPLTDAEGLTILDDIDFYSLGNVEVIKGPSGTLYGSAIAGVVNLSTITPEAGTFSIGQEAFFGSYGLSRLTSHLALGGKNASLLVNYGHQHSDGFMARHTMSNKDFVNVAANITAGDKESFQAYFGYTNSYDERAGELTIAQYENKDYSGNPDYIKNDAHSAISGFHAGLSHTYAFNRHIANTSTVFASANSNHSSSAAGWTDKTPLNYGFRSTLDIHYDLPGNWRISGITGMETQAENAMVAGYKMVADSSHPEGYNIIGPMKSNQSVFANTSSYFTEWTLSMPHDLSITAGVGLTTLYLRLNNRLYSPGSNAPASYAQNYNNMVAPHLAVNKVFNNRYSLYFSYAQAYRPPVSGDILITATGELNTDLKPEEGSQWEIGTKGNILDNSLHYELAAFYARFSNKMTSVAVPLNAGTTAYTYTANGGDQLDKGLELYLSWEAYQSSTGFFRTVHPFANLSYSDYKYSGLQFGTLDKNKEPEVADYDGKAVAGVAPLTANIGMDLEMKWGLYANAAFNHRDGMPITSDNEYNTSAYNLLNAKLGIRRTVCKHFNVNAFAGANNITGTQYYYMVFLNQLPDAYLPAPDKINYYGRVELTYEIR